MFYNAELLISQDKISILQLSKSFINKGITFSFLKTDFNKLNRWVYYVNF